jgi:aminoglycoside N3'-acetyltransferase
MKRTKKDELLAHLVDLGLERGRSAVVHSSLPAFGVIDGGIPQLFDCLREIVGPEATLAVPTYRLSAPQDEIFDRILSPSQKVGAFSEFFRLLPEAVRSANPLHSHAFLGPMAQHFAMDVVRPSFGPDSDFAFFAEHGFLCVCLGCDLENAGTFVFHAQALAGSIPYREWQTFRRLCYLHGAAEPVQLCSFDYYARKAGAPKETRREVQNRMHAAGLLRSAAASYGESVAFECRMAASFLTRLFQNEPLICLSKPGAEA